MTLHMSHWIHLLGHFRSQEAGLARTSLSKCVFLSDLGEVTVVFFSFWVSVELQQTFK